MVIKIIGAVKGDKIAVNGKILDIQESGNYRYTRDDVSGANWFSKQEEKSTYLDISKPETWTES